MLTKLSLVTIAAPIAARDAQPMWMSCPDRGGGHHGSSGGSEPTPGTRCVTIKIMGPAPPWEGGGMTVIGFRTVCP
jgi:hypothetical protein